MGHEERVVEGLLRCVITASVQDRMGWDYGILTRHINSSHTTTAAACIRMATHRHVVPAVECAIGWKEMSRLPNLVSRVHRTERRATHKADLFIVTADGEVVSIEFKHLHARRRLDREACLSQMRRYAKHAGSVLVIYAATPVAADLGEARRWLAERLRRGRRVVVVQGPAVQITRHTGRRTSARDLRRLL